MHLTLESPQGAMSPQPPVTKAIRLTTFPLNVPQPSPRHLPVSWPLGSFSPHRACGSLPLAFLSPPVSSHPSLSARFSHPSFLWHLSIVLILRTVQIFTFLQPSVFVRFLPLQPNKDSPLKSTHSETVGWEEGGRCTH